ncbi:hypothetical protein EON66_10685 [archaeon]|nr:MAG: hypothetical protein EON66_10685 [archaeon]
MDDLLKSINAAEAAGITVHLLPADSFKASHASALAAISGAEARVSERLDVSDLLVPSRRDGAGVHDLETEDGGDTAGAAAGSAGGKLHQNAGTHQGDGPDFSAFETSAEAASDDVRSVDAAGHVATSTSVPPPLPASDAEGMYL